MTQVPITPTAGSAVEKSPSHECSRLLSPTAPSSELIGPDGSYSHFQATPTTTAASTWGRKMMVRTAAPPRTRACVINAVRNSPIVIGSTA